MMRPLPKARSIHRENLIRGRQLVHPRLDLVRLRWILVFCLLDSSLQFAHGHSGKEQLFVFLIAEPGNHCAPADAAVGARKRRWCPAGIGTPELQYRTSRKSRVSASKLSSEIPERATGLSSGRGGQLFAVGSIVRSGRVSGNRYNRCALQAVASLW
jgi:hypothetical protein